MSGEQGSTEAGEFAALLRELKDRSGLSYGALAKRVHMSASTLHRYCSGGAVPGEYASLDRLARVCRATPHEVVELHRRWVLADAARRPRVDPPAATPDAAAEPEESATEPAAAKDVPAWADATEPAPPDEPVVVHVPPNPAKPRRRTVLFTSAAVAAVLVAASLLARPLWKGDGGNGTGRQQAVGATSPATGAQEPQAAPSPSTRSSTPSAPAAATTPTTAPAMRGAVPTQGSSRHGTPAAPLTVSTRPYVYDSPCDQRFLVDKPPGQVGPFPDEQDAPRWVAANGAVAAGEQQVALTVQGRRGAGTVVLEALHVNVDSKHAPLAWNDYAMDECGGMVETKSFDVDLDEGSPSPAVTYGQRDFPYKVSESDPEVFYVFADARAHDVSWYLELDWSSGARSGTVRVDDNGKLFRTSGNVGRPAYDYPLGGSEWKTAATG